MAGGTDELVQRVLSAASTLSDANVDRLVSEARSEAEAEVKMLLKSALKAAMLQRALGRLEEMEFNPAAQPTAHEASPHAGAERSAAPAPIAQEQVDPPESDLGDACYVYCITSASHPLDGISDDGRAGAARHIQGAGPPAAVRCRELQAIVSTVPLSDFGQSALNRHAQDAQWLETNARAHDATLKSLMSAGTIVPLRFCTILADEQAVRSVLETNYEQLVELLAALEASREWGVKILAAAPEPVEAQAATGREYLLRKSNETLASRTGSDQTRGEVGECHQQLSAFARDTVLLPRHDHSTALNAAYLVEAEHEREFLLLADSLGRQLREDNLTVEVTGPWPPYNFVNLSLTAQRAT